MENKEKFRILMDAEDKAFRFIDTAEATDMVTEDFGRLIRVCEDFACMIHSLDMEMNPPPEFMPADPQPMAEPVTKEEKKETPAPVAEAPKGLTKTEVRAALGRMTDVDIGSVMDELGGWHKLSEVPADRYQDLIDVCEAKRGQ